MGLTVITINRNNAAGLEKTMRSVLIQTRADYEYVVVDGASTDDSVAVIQRLAPAFGDRLKWISEPDKGIYSAMNKGIRMATGEYVYFLNSGDRFVSSDVVDKVCDAFEKEAHPPILYGNRIKFFPDGHTVRDRFTAGKEITFYHFYSSTLGHQNTFIQRSLFDRYGFYDETLVIVSDWKWFIQVIVLGGERVAYVDMDITYYDMTGISQSNFPLHVQERMEVLSSIFPARILADYHTRVFELEQIKRLKRHPWSYKMVWFLERCLSKWEKWMRALKKKR